MAPREEVNDIVQNFVDNDLASLDRIGGETDTFSLSPHLAEPDRRSQPSHTTSKQGPVISASSSSGRTGPLVSGVPKSGSASGLAGADAGSSQDGTSRSISQNLDQTLDQNISSVLGSRSAGSDSSRYRHASTNSTTSVSTLEREKRASLGDKFKKFGKRITSGSKK